MTYRLLSFLVAAAMIVLSGEAVRAQASKELKVYKNKPAVLNNLLATPNNCGSEPGPVPLPRLREKPSHGGVGLQIVMAHVAATDACPARTVPSIVLFYTPTRILSARIPSRSSLKPSRTRLFPAAAS